MEGWKYTARNTVLAAALLLGLPTPAGATGDLFRFEASKGEFYFSLEMVGREDPGSVQISSSDFRSYMPHRPYYIEFNRAQRRAYIRPRERSDLPWFELDVVGNTGVLHYKGMRLTGTADWTIR